LADTDARGREAAELLQLFDTGLVAASQAAERVPRSSPGTAQPVDARPRDLASAASGCQATPTGVQQAASEAQFRALLVGDWFLCDSPSVFGTSDEVGLARMKTGAGRSS
jgi:hypothetical protein